jgi:hypothetical protein
MDWGDKILNGVMILIFLIGLIIFPILFWALYTASVATEKYCKARGWETISIYRDGYFCVDTEGRLVKPKLEK